MNKQETETWVKDRVQQFRDGMISEDELRGILSAHQIRGSFSPSGWTGYDYVNQQWIES